MKTFTTQAIRPARRPDRAEPTVVVLDDRGQLWLASGSRLRGYEKLLARWRGFSLDARLAAGSSPDSDRLLAARARMLVAPARRERLARDWGLLLRAARQRPAMTPRVPLCRDRILAAEPAILGLQDALRVRLPVPARGAAMAASLLADATGPVFNRRSPTDLTAALRAAVAHLDPFADLLPGQSAQTGA